MKPLERVQKLIALTASPNEHEARNAAYEACKLIREHKLVVSEVAPVVPDFFGFANPPAASTSPPTSRAKKTARAVVNFVTLLQEAAARSKIEKLRPDLRRLARNYTPKATRELADAAEQLGLIEEAAVLRAAAG